jgi:polyphosphate kinase 2 (PPK2 family)
METEKSILQMLEHLLARQEKADADAEARHEEIKARQEMADDEAKVRHERSLAILDGWKSYGKGTPTCQTETTSCPGEMDATTLEATPEETEAPVERQELFKEKLNNENVGSSEDRSRYQRLAV